MFCNFTVKTIKNMSPFKITIFFTFCLLVASCSSSKKLKTPIPDIVKLKYINTYEIPYNMEYNNTTVGGLSGIDYDAANNLYYFICDDRSDKNPARFYKARIYFTQNGIDSLAFIGQYFMLGPDGNTYPNKITNKYKVPDPEAMRYNPQQNQLVWSSEGERIITSKDTVLEDPAILLISPEGKYIDSFVLPHNLHMQLIEKGPRKNSVFEGLAFTDNYKKLYVSVEEPLYDDGPPAELVENDAYIRILKYDVATKKNTAQYLYKLSPIAHPSNPPTAFKINGVSDIMSIGNNKLLVIERSFSTGRMACSIKLFVANLTGATNVINSTAKDNKSFIPAKKTLLLNLDSLGIYTDNIEGITFGPDLPNGNKTFLLIADNNFSSLEKTQILLFELTN